LDITTGEIPGASSGIRAIPDVPGVRPAVMPRRLEWRVATVTAVHNETRRARSLVLHIPDWPGHRAGQHVDVRLVAEDGYEAQRSYSIASSPERSTVELTVERLDDGEVSPYLCDVLGVGDGVEVRGPIGGYFVWNIAQGGPLWLVAGGSGIVPLMAMLRHYAAAPEEARARIPVRLLYSARSVEDVIYRDELNGLSVGQIKVALALTRDAPPGWAGYRRRIDRVMLEEVGWPPADAPRVFVCGPTPLVENVANLLVEIGHEPMRVRTERFGPTG
jgi:ferredoxin-NADP reductase